MNKQIEIINARLTRLRKEQLMTERTRLICIVLTILCIIAALVGQCNAAGEVERIAARTKSQVRAMIAMEESSRTNYGASYIPNTYSGQSQYQEQTVVNQNINRNTVIVEQSEPYYYPVYFRQNDRQHWDAVNRAINR
jgi:hypothetical protein